MYCAHFEIGRSHDDLSSLCAIKIIVHARESRAITLATLALKHCAKSNGARHRYSARVHANATVQRY